MDSRSRLAVILGFLFLALIAGYSRLELQMSREENQSLNYLVGLFAAEPKIRPGMTRSEVLAVVGTPPDRFENTVGEAKLEWSDAYQPKPLSLFMYPGRDGNGSYLIVEFGPDGLVKSKSFEPSK